MLKNGVFGFHDNCFVVKYDEKRMDRAIEAKSILKDIVPYVPADGRLLFEQPLSSGCSLHRYLEELARFPAELDQDMMNRLDRAIRIGKEITEALAFIHGKDMIVCNLSCESIFFVGEEVKIGNFTAAVRSTNVPENHYVYLQILLNKHTEPFFAPEVCKIGSTYAVTKLMDVFSLGVILFEILFGHPRVAVQSTFRVKMIGGTENRIAILRGSEIGRALMELMANALKNETERRLRPLVQNILVDLLQWGGPEMSPEERAVWTRLNEQAVKEAKQHVLDVPAAAPVAPPVAAPRRAEWIRPFLAKFDCPVRPGYVHKEATIIRAPASRDRLGAGTRVFVDDSQLFGDGVEGGPRCDDKADGPEFAELHGDCRLQGL